MTTLPLRRINILPLCPHLEQRYSNFVSSALLLPSTDSLQCGHFTAAPGTSLPQWGHFLTVLATAWLPGGVAGEVGTVDGDTEGIEPGVLHFGQRAFFPACSSLTTAVWPHWTQRNSIMATTFSQGKCLEAVPCPLGKKNGSRQLQSPLEGLAQPTERSSLTGSQTGSLPRRCLSTCKSASFPMEQHLVDQVQILTSPAILRLTTETVNAFS